MENEQENENKNKHESSSLLIVPIDDVTNKKEPLRSKRFMALSGTIAAATTTAAVVVLTHHSSGAAIVTPIVSTLSSLLGTGRKQGESCGGFLEWNRQCNNGLSCFTGGHSGSGRYCVPNGQEYACCGYDSGEAAGIDCSSGLSCMGTFSGKSPISDGVDTCYNANNVKTAKFAKTGSCNVNNGEPANQFVPYHGGDMVP